MKRAALSRFPRGDEIWWNLPGAVADGGANKGKQGHQVGGLRVRSRRALSRLSLPPNEASFFGEVSGGGKGTCTSGD